MDVCTDWNEIFNVSGAHPRCSDLDNVKNAPTWSQRANRVRLCLRWGSFEIVNVCTTQGAPDVGPTRGKRPPVRSSCLLFFAFVLAPEEPTIAVPNLLPSRSIPLSTDLSPLFPYT